MQITTTLNRIKVFEDCEPVVAALMIRLGKEHPDDKPVAFSTTLKASGLAYTILCCKAEPQHNDLWRRYAVDCLETIRHLMGSRSYCELDFEQSVFLGKDVERYVHLGKGPHRKGGAYGAAHDAHLTAICGLGANDPNHEYKKARESAAIGVLALTQGYVSIKTAIPVLDAWRELTWQYSSDANLYEQAH